MSVIWKIPDKARYIPTANLFAATFNMPVVGQYSYNVAANANQPVLTLQPKTVYLIERVTLSGDVAKEDYTASLDASALASVPRIILKRSQDRSVVFTTGIPILTFIEQQDLGLWIISDREDDSLTATVTGVINQIPATVGKATITLAVSFGIYAVDANDWQRYYRDRLSVTAGRALRT